MTNKSNDICIILIVSLLVVSLTPSYKIPFFEYAVAQPSIPELKTKASPLTSNVSSSSLPNTTSSNQSLNDKLNLLLSPDLRETPLADDEPSYTVKNKTSVQANNSGLIGASCHDGDGLVIGGYFLTTSDGDKSLSDVIISANFPMIMNVTTPSAEPKIAERGTQPQSSVQEGWTTGVINNGDIPLELGVNALCLNLNR